MKLMPDATLTIVKHDTRLLLEESACRVIVKSIKCFGYVLDQETTKIDEADVTFHMTNRESECCLLLVTC